MQGASGGSILEKKKRNLNQIDRIPLLLGENTPVEGGHLLERLQIIRPTRGIMQGRWTGRALPEETVNAGGSSGIQDVHGSSAIPMR